MFREPPFQFFSPSLKILALIMVMIITFLVVLALGMALSIPFFGQGLLNDLAALTDYSDPRTVYALKYFQIINQIGIFIAPAILFVILTDDNFSRYLNLDRGYKKFSIFFGFIVLVVSLPFINWLVTINSEMHLPAFLSRVEDWMRDSEDNAQRLTDAFLKTGEWGGFLVNLVMIAGLAAIGEELIFRGILVRLFGEWTQNVHLSVIIPAMLFSALHLQFYGFFGRFLLGIILGYLFIWSGSLWVPIMVHFLNNAMAVILSFFNQRGIITADLETFGSTQNEYIIAGSFVLMVLSMSIIYLHHKGYFKKNEDVS
jgi:membrane protease YdiL (CAAX protease family)